MAKISVFFRLCGLLVGTVFFIGDELRSGGWAQLVHALAKAHVLIDELLWLSSLMCLA